MRKMIRFACRILCLVMLFAWLAFCMPAGAAEDVQMIEITFRSFLTASGSTWSFPYSDAFFLGESDRYSHDIAKASMGLAMAAGHSCQEPYDASALSFFTQAGFVDLEGKDYDTETSQSTIATMIGHKTLSNGETLLAVGVCGLGYGNEWLSNLNIGDEQNHCGFALAAKEVEGRILAYMKAHSIDKNCKLWISGYSRAAAITNLLSASLMEQKIFDTKNAFVYTMATPRTTREPVAYPNIFNIVGKFDPATQIPYSEWGFGRHGNDLFTPAQETDSDYRQRRIPAGHIYEKLTGQLFKNSTAINHNYTIIAEYLTSIIPSTSYYDLHMHEHLEEVWENPNLSTVRDLIYALSSPIELSTLSDMEHKERVEDLVDYLTGVVYGVLTTRENPGGVTSELLLEHMPEVYIAWLFSSDDPEAVYTGHDEYVHLVLEGDANVTLFDQKGGFVLSMDPEGTCSEETDVERYQKRIRPIEDRPVIAVAESEERVLVLPRDQGMPFVIDALSEGEFSYYGVNYNINTCKPTVSTVRMISMEKDEQYLAFSFTDEGMVRMMADDNVWGDADVTATFVQENELLSVEITASLEGYGDVSISVKTILLVVVTVLAVLFLLLVLFLILVIRIMLKIIRRIKRKKLASLSE